MRLAQISIPSPSTVFTNYNTLVGDVISRIILFAIPIAGMYFFVKLLEAGFHLLVSRGESGNVQSAQTGLVNATFGLLIVIASYFIFRIVVSILGINTT